MATGRPAAIVRALVPTGVLLVAAWVIYRGSGPFDVWATAAVLTTVALAWLIHVAWLGRALKGGHTRTAVVGFSATLLLTSALVLTARPSGEQPELGERLSDRVTSASDGSSIDLNAVLGNGWSRGYLFMGYLNAADIDQALGFHWPASSRTGIETSDEGIVVLVDNESVVAWSSVPSDTLFEFPFGFASFTPNDATFVTRRSGDQFFLCEDAATCGTSVTRSRRNRDSRRS